MNQRPNGIADGQDLATTDLILILFADPRQVPFVGEISSYFAFISASKWF